MGKLTQGMGVGYTVKVIRFVSFSTAFIEIEHNLLLGHYHGVLLPTLVI